MNDDNGFTEFRNVPGSGAAQEADGRRGSGNQYS